MTVVDLCRRQRVTRLLVSLTTGIVTRGPSAMFLDTPVVLGFRRAAFDVCEVTAKWYTTKTAWPTTVLVS